ncbi:MAG TPA: DMT family transporter [bacterium]|nr:DMT family transporter [bacterium]
MRVVARGPADEAREQALGIGLVLLAALLWSSSGLFIKLLHVNPLALTGLRSGLATLSLLPFVRYRALRLDGTMLVLMVAFSLTQAFFVTATRWTTAANAIALQATAPAWVFLLGWLATRRVQAPLLLPMALIVGGIAAMLAEPAHGTSLQGNLLGLASGLTFAVSLICFKRVNQPAVGTVALANLASALGMVALFPGAFRLGGIAGWEWGVLVYLGAIQIGLALLCFTAGVRRITVSQASVLTLLEPLLNPVWVFLVIGELPSAYGFTGYALILAGIVADFWLRLSLPSLQRVPGAGSA